MITHLFVYGSLMGSISSPIANYLKNNSQFLGEAFLEGTLYDIGKYPGLIPQPNIGRWVKGHVFQLSNPKEMLLVLDRYEGLGEGFPEPTEYLRVPTQVLLNKETIACWVYQYNYSTEQLSIIESGDYLQYFKTNKAFQEFVQTQVNYTRPKAKE